MRLRPSKPGQAASCLAFDQDLERNAQQRRCLLNAGVTLRCGDEFVIEGESGPHDTLRFLSASYLASIDVGFNAGCGAASILSPFAAKFPGFRGRIASWEP
jgi:hypothetical protein